MTSGSPTTSSKPSTPVSGKSILGPFGYGTIRLGQTQAIAAQESVFVTKPAATTSCQSWQTSLASQIDFALISPKAGVAGIYPRSAAAMQTPEGLTVGWTVDQVHAAYPSFDVGDAHEEDGGPEIKVPQNPEAAYKVRFDANDKVVSFFLMLSGQDCFG